jgi:hypothetical protein
MKMGGPAYHKQEAVLQRPQLRAGLQQGRLLDGPRRQHARDAHAVQQAQHALRAKLVEPRPHGLAREQWRVDMRGCPTEAARARPPFAVGSGPTTEQLAAINPVPAAPRTCSISAGAVN